MNSIQAIQMIGTQRSGSNLLRLMLNQLDGVSAPHPPHILERFIPLLPAYDDLTTPSNFASLVDDVCKLIEVNPVPWNGIELDRQTIIDRCKRPLLTEIFRVIYELRAESEGSWIWICKSMVNIRFAAQLEENGIKPRYLFLYRDGRDVALSFKKAIVGEKHIYHIASQWKQEQEASLRLIEILGDSRVISVCYEKLIANPEEELKKFCTFLGIEYNPKALDYYQSKESQNTAMSGKMWQNVEKPLITDNFNKFRKELDNDDIALFERVAGDTLEKLGYSRCFPTKTQGNFSTEEIAAFTELNQSLKQQARQMQKPEDLQKRKKQEDLLQGIQKRITENRVVTPKGKVIWLYGRPCSGKTTIGLELTNLLTQNEQKSILIDGDDLRNGLNRDLGFTIDDRFENIRRAAEMASFIASKENTVVICTFITPLKELRTLAQTIAQQKNIPFTAVYVDTPLELCMLRDVKGHYRSAASGKIHQFTGVSSPFEVPDPNDSCLSTVNQSPTDCARKIIELID